MQTYLKISVVTCSYNQGIYLENTIKSVITQNYPNLEYIIMDGNSTDNSVDIIKKYSNYLKYWQSEKDNGQSDAINKGFAKATGDIFCWLNSDDLLAPHSLFKINDFFTRIFPEENFVYGDCDLIDKNGKCIKRLKEPYWYEPWQRYVRNCVAQPSAFWRKELWEKVGGLDTSLHWAMDLDLWFKFSRLTKMYHIPAVLSFQRQYAETKTARGGIERATSIEKVLKRYFPDELPIIKKFKKIIFKLHRIATKLILLKY